MKLRGYKICAVLLGILALSGCGVTPSEPSPEEPPPPTPEEKVLVSTQFEGSTGYNVSGAAVIGELEGQLSRTLRS